jgi:hypothetical protein
VIILIVAAISLYYFRETYCLIEHAPRKELLVVMAQRLFTKSTISLLSSVVLVTAISIPMGIYLFHLISDKYLTVFNEVKRIAEKGRSLNIIRNNLYRKLKQLGIPFKKDASD